MQVLFTISGIVKKGAQRGRELGYPTANVSLETHIPEGVYAAQIEVESHTYNAATFIGSAPTYGDKEYKSESYIIDFDQDIYGKQVTINLYKKLRDNEKFVSEEKLIAQIKEDIVLTRDFFRNQS